MARCEELNTKMKEMQPVAEQMYPLLESKMFLIIKPQARQRQLGHMVITQKLSRGVGLYGPNCVFLAYHVTFYP